VIVAGRYLQHFCTERTAAVHGIWLWDYLFNVFFLTSQCATSCIEVKVVHSSGYSQDGKGRTLTAAAVLYQTYLGSCFNLYVQIAHVQVTSHSNCWNSACWNNIYRAQWQQTMYEATSQLITGVFFSQSQLVTQLSRHTVISSQASIVQSYG